MSESSVAVTGFTATSAGPNTVEATTTVTNTVESGDGERKEALVRFSIDGDFTDDLAFDPPIGGDQTVTIEIDGVDAGTREICAEVVETF